MDHIEPKPFNVKILNAEYESLYRLTGRGIDLVVVWKPCADKPLLCEIKDNVIYNTR